MYHTKTNNWQRAFFLYSAERSLCKQSNLDRYHSTQMWRCKINHKLVNFAY